MYVIAMRLAPAEGKKYPNTLALTKLINETYLPASQRELPVPQRSTKFDPDKIYSLGELVIWMQVMGNSISDVEALEIKEIQKSKGFERGKKQEAIQQKIHELQTKNRESYLDIHDKIIPGFLKEYQARLIEAEKKNPGEFKLVSEKKSLDATFMTDSALNMSVLDLQNSLKKKFTKEVKEKSITPVKESKWTELGKDLNHMKTYIGQLADKLDKYMYPNVPSKEEFEKAVPAMAPRSAMIYSPIVLASGGGGKEKRRPEDIPWVEEFIKYTVTGVLPKLDPPASFSMSKFNNYFKELDSEPALTEDEAKAVKEQMQKDKESYLQEQKRTDEAFKNLGMVRESVKIPTPIVLAHGIQNMCELFRLYHSLYHGAMANRKMREQETLEEGQYKVPREKPVEKKAEVQTPEATVIKMKADMENAVKSKDSAVAHANYFAGLSIDNPHARSAAKDTENACHKCSVNSNMFFSEIREMINQLKKPTEKRGCWEILQKVALETGFDWTEFTKKWGEVERKAEKGLDALDAFDHASASKELQHIKNYFMPLYKNPPPSVVKKAREFDTTPTNFLGMYMNTAAEMFVKKWTAKREESKDTGDWIEKYPHILEGIEKLKKHLPPFSEKKKEEFTPGKPSSDDVVKYIEDNWMHRKPKEMVERYEKEKLGDMGGGINRTKKAPVTELTAELLSKVTIMKYLATGKRDDWRKNDMTPSDLIHEIIQHVVTRLKVNHQEGNAAPTLEDMVGSLLHVFKQLPTLLHSVYIGLTPDAQKAYEMGSKTKEVSVAPGGIHKKQRVLMSDPTKWTQMGTPPDFRVSTGEECDYFLKKTEDLLKKVDELVGPKDSIYPKSKQEWEARGGIGPRGLMDAGAAFSDRFNLDKLYEDAMKEKARKKEEEKALEKKKPGPAEEKAPPAEKPVEKEAYVPMPLRVAGKFADAEVDIVSETAAMLQ